MLLELYQYLLIVAGIIAIVTTALQIAGVISMNTARLLFVFAWLFGVVAACALLNNAPTKHLAITALVTGLPLALALFAIERWAVKKVRERDEPPPIKEPQEERQLARTAADTTSELIFGQPFEGFDTVRITMNGEHFTDWIHYLEHEEYTGRVIGEKVTGGFPIHIHVADRKPLIDAKVYTKSGFVKIKRSRLVKKPTGWDENSNDRAIEIVNEKQSPVFQVLLVSSEHIDIAGIFSENDAKSSQLARIFKYPSAEHRGELNRKLDILPLTAKSLFTLYLTGCPDKSVTYGQYRLKNGFDIELMGCADLDTRAFHLSVFVPGLGRNTEPIIRQLAEEYKSIAETFAESALSAFLRMRPGERPEYGKGLTFTRLVNIYNEGLLVPSQIEELEHEFVERGAHVRFYDGDYVVTRNSPLYQGRE